MTDSSYLTDDLSPSVPTAGWGSLPLQTAEEHYHQLVQALPAAVYLCDIHGRVKLFNDAAAQLWGRQPVIGQDFWCGSLRIFSLDGTPIPLDSCPMAVTLREQREVTGHEVLIERSDGTRRNVLPFPRLIRDSAGNALGAINMLVDITDIKQNETTLKETADYGLRSKDRFLAVLSHELRTPLTPVAMAAASIAGNPDLPPAVREEIELIRRNVDLETKLIDDLLDLSRIASGKLRLQFRDVDLNDLVTHALDACRPEIREKRIKLRVDLCADHAKVHADPARLQQVIWNLLKNAVKFTPEAGEIQLATQRAGDRLRITVRDNGIGISADAIDSIFDAFEHGDSPSARQFGGLGLGLAISKALVELHHGKINVASDGVGKGATFMIDLLETTAKMESQTPNTDVPQSASLRLLLVEDHADTSRMLVKLLVSAGYTVRTANNAAGAIELASREPFDLIVSDIGLPDASGYHLMQQLKQQFGLAGIAMSGYGMDDDIRKSQEAGFAEHLVKPISFAQLEQAIQKIARP
jgi:signal transduction histidine kinase/CheY-like chemotaxis protein